MGTNTPVKKRMGKYAILAEEQCESGKSIAAFCRERGIDPNKLYAVLNGSKKKLLKESGFIEIQGACLLREEPITMRYGACEFFFPPALFRHVLEVVQERVKV